MGVGGEWWGLHFSNRAVRAYSIQWIRSSHHVADSLLYRQCLIPPPVRYAFDSYIIVTCRTPCHYYLCSMMGMDPISTVSHAFGEGSRPPPCVHITNWLFWTLHTNFAWDPSGSWSNSSFVEQKELDTFTQYSRARYLSRYHGPPRTRSETKTRSGRSSNGIKRFKWVWIDLRWRLGLVVVVWGNPQGNVESREWFLLWFSLKTCKILGLSVKIFHPGPPSSPLNMKNNRAEQDNLRYLSVKTLTARAEQQ